MSWEKVKLKEITEYITDGDHQPAPKATTGVRFIKIRDIKNNQISFDNCLFVPTDYYESLPSNRKPQKGDTLYTVVGSYGLTAFVNDFDSFCFERNIALLHPNLKVVPKFLFYLLNNPVFHKQADNIANGSAQKLIPLSKISNMEVYIPVVKLQECIAGILSAYDDLIENNQKQIKLLEEAAQRLYKEWFVDLHFPGWENATIIDGVPEGWRKVKFSSEVDIMSGGTPKTGNKSYYGGNIPFYTPKDSDGSFFAFETEIKITDEGLDNCNSRLYPENTIIITARGTVGKTTILGVPMAMNQSCYALAAKDFEAPYYVFFALNREIDILKTMANGGVFNTIIVKTFDSIFITIPSNNLIQKFENAVTPFMDQIKNKMRAIKYLKEARDRLLPKLMSGELEV